MTEDVAPRKRFTSADQHDLLHSRDDFERRGEGSADVRVSHLASLSLPTLRAGDSSPSANKGGLFERECVQLLRRSWKTGSVGPDGALTLPASSAPGAFRGSSFAWCRRVACFNFEAIFSDF